MRHKGNLLLKGHWRQPASWFQTEVGPPHSHFSIDLVPRCLKCWEIAVQLLIKRDANTTAVAVCIRINRKQVKQRWLIAVYKQLNTTLPRTKQFGQFRSNRSCFPKLPCHLPFETTKQNVSPLDLWSVFTLHWRKTLAFWGPASFGVERFSHA